MQKGRTISLKTKMLGGFLLLIALFFISNLYNIYNTKNVESLSTLQVKRAADEKTVMKFVKTIGILYSYQADLIINDNTETIQKYKEEAKQFNRLANKISESADTKEEKEWVHNLETYTEEYIKLFDRIVHLYTNKSTVSPEVLRLEYKKIDNETDTVKEKLFELTTHINQSYANEFEEVNQQLQRKINDSILNSLISTIVSVILGIIAAFVLAKMITNPIDQMIVLTRKVAEGDLTRKITVQSRDEIAQLAHSFNTMIDNLRNLIKKVDETTNQVTNSSKELNVKFEQATKAQHFISTTLLEIAGGADTQTKGTQENQHVMEEISIVLQGVAQTASTVAESSIEVLQQAEQGNQIIRHTIEQMDNNINSFVNSSSSVVTDLEKSSKQIGQIIEVISGIASQTNLLALNASIEAARAGEHGKGFAVVANEVRKLAEQSKQSTEQIERLIKEMQANTNHIVHIMDKETKEIEKETASIHKAGDVFQHILHSIQHVTKQVQDVSSSTEEMSASIEEITASTVGLNHIATQISTSTNEIADSTAEHVGSMNEIASLADHLNTTAYHLKNEVSKFKV